MTRQRLGTPAALSASVNITVLDTACLPFHFSRTGPSIALYSKRLSLQDSTEGRGEDIMNRRHNAVCQQASDK
ncbi:hypothetical protein J6590_057785 [Homalodisca vitripennis]|nr:hypothetical protein J6590_057785 [Homalodisca vitripennis]